jgi:hypothetical protein
MQIELHEFLPLSEEYVELYVPARAGVLMLARLLANGVHEIFLTQETSNLYRALHEMNRGDESGCAPILAECPDRFRCTFSFFTVDEEEFRNQVAKILSHSADPVRRLFVVNCN